MKNIFLVYDNCCFYEIVILSYFMKFTGQEIAFCSVDGKEINCMEGYSVNVDMALKDVNINDVKCLTITGGDISDINNKTVRDFIKNLVDKGAIISAICAGVDVLDDAGILNGVKSTHSEDTDVSNDKNIITARANAYVDFAIEVAKKLDLFEDENDLQETINFWKYHKRVQ
ncbi:DJ-1/PfpI family protein [Clostridium nigeriense]|uniref:DJ-1/PfpI family protein n=1 Tax=Clostridium nigeriense TaxID=1805470 RepID=UPI003D355698